MQTLQRHRNGETETLICRGLFYKNKTIADEIHELLNLLEKKSAATHHFPAEADPGSNKNDICQEFAQGVRGVLKSIKK